jgi:hypothetical protein
MSVSARELAGTAHKFVNNLRRTLASVSCATSFQKENSGIVNTEAMRASDWERMELTLQGELMDLG